MNNALNERLIQMVRDAVSPGLTAISFALMQDGEEIAAGAVGTRDGRPDHPASPNDLYNIGSISKVYIAAAIMKLVEMGKVDLDAPVVKYLPRFKMADPRYKDITVRMTLCHSSGLPGTHWKNVFTYSWLGDDYFEESYDYFAHSRLKAAPGEYTTYCNDGFTLAEMVAVEVSGMPLSDFLRKYFLAPLGALSTCASDRLPAGYDHVVMKSAAGVERLSIIGAGGINSNMGDVCRFGNSFLTHSALSKASCDEMAKPHGIPVPPQDSFATLFGLGWDRVSFPSAVCDMGEGVLMKSGGTLQFLSFLLVIPKYNMVAAISGTMDTGADHLDLLSRLVAEAVREKTGQDILYPQTAARHDFSPAPAELAGQFEGYYASPYAVYQAEFSEGRLNIYNLTLGEKQPLYMDMQYSGGCFYGKGPTVSFVEHNGYKYIFADNAYKALVPVMQKLENLTPLSDVWKARDGRQYYSRAADYLDGMWGDSAAIITLKRFPYVDGIMLACVQSNPDTGTPMIIPLAVENDHLSRMFLNASSSASRDQFAAEFYEQDGSEEMYFFGLRFRDISYDRQPLEAGEIAVQRGEVRIFAIPEGKKPVVYVPDRARLLLVNRDFQVVYDSFAGGAVPDVGGGYALFAGETGRRFSVLL